MTHSYQEFESRAAIERGSGRAAMRACSIARTELTPVNRSRSRACAARIIARECVGSRHTGGVSRAPIWPLTSVHGGVAATENRRPGRCRGRCSVRPAPVESRSWKTKWFRGTASRSGVRRQNFGDVPIGLSHGGRRSRSDPGFARTRRRCADPGSGPDAGAKYAVEIGGRPADGNAGHRWQRAAMSPVLAGPPAARSRSCAVDDAGVIGGAGGAREDRLPTAVSRSRAISSVRRTPVLIGNGRFHRSPTDWLPRGARCGAVASGR